jgi:hypothetical protein
MHELDRIERRRRENDELYNEIEGKELPAKHQFWVRLAEIAPRLHPVCFIGVTSMAVLMMAIWRDVAWYMPYVATVAVAWASLGALVLQRGKDAATGKYGDQGPAQPGGARASPRKARASPGHERGG